MMPDKGISVNRIYRILNNNRILKNRIELREENSRFNIQTIIMI